MAENLPDNAPVAPHFVDATIIPPECDTSAAGAIHAFREQQNAWQPRTALGNRLKELRSQFVAAGGTLLTNAEIEIERRKRQGTSLAED